MRDALLSLRPDGREKRSATGAAARGGHHTQKHQDDVAACTLHPAQWKRGLWVAWSAGLSLQMKGLQGLQRRSGCPGPVEAGTSEIRDLHGEQEKKPITLRGLGVEDQQLLP